MLAKNVCDDNSSWPLSHLVAGGRGRHNKLYIPCDILKVHVPWLIYVLLFTLLSHVILMNDKVGRDRHSFGVAWGISERNTTIADIFRVISCTRADPSIPPLFFFLLKQKEAILNTKESKNCVHCCSKKKKPMRDM